MKRVEFFRNLQAELKASYASNKIALTRRRFIEEIRSRLPDQIWDRIKHRIDEKFNGLLHHKSLDYPTSVKARRKVKEQQAQWQRDRYVYMFGDLCCKTCGASEGPLFSKFSRKKAIQLKDLYDFCSDSCSKKHPDAKAKREASCMAEYGVSNATFLPQHKLALRAVYDDPDRVAEILEKRRNTQTENYGSTEAFEAQRAAKAAKTNRNKYGGPAPTCSPAVLKKRSDNYMREHGVSNPSQNPEVWNKIQNSWKRSKTLTVAGVTFTGLQGYEPQAIECILRNSKVSPSMLSTKVNPVKYKFAGRSRYYFPDLKINNTLIEVKSSYTIGIFFKGASSDNHADYEKNRAKLSAAAAAGFKVMLLIYEPKINKCFVFKGPLPSRKSLKRRYEAWITTHS